jgi:DNA-binding MarR family transcriptional regulator
MALQGQARARAVAREAAAPEGTVALGPLAGVLGYHIAQAAVTTVDLFERHIGVAFELRKVEFSLLMLLLANSALAPKQLARELALTAPALTSLLDRLQERGLIRRERNPADGRSQHIVLSDKGLAVSRASAAAALPMERELLGKLTSAEHAMLIQLLSRVAGGRRHA